MEESGNLAGSLERLLEIEGSAEILEFRFATRDTMIWPFVRWAILMDGVVSDYTRRDGINWGVEQKLKMLFRYLWTNLRSSALLLPKSRVLYIAKGKALVNRGGRYSNRITDPLATISGEQSSIIESTGIAGLRIPRTAERVGYYDLLKSGGERLARARRIEYEDLRTIGRFYEFLRSRALLEQSAEGLRWLERELAKLSRALTFRYRMYDRLLTRIGPSVLIVECGHYGEHADLIRMAHERGIFVAEPQHGFVGPSHPAYNFSGAVAQNKEFGRYFPDKFLVYGEFWGEQIRIPGRYEVIGNPWFEEMSSVCVDNEVRSGVPPALLVVSNGADFDAVANKAIKIADGDPEGWRISLRPSPRDKGRISAVTKAALEEKGIELSYCDNLYQDICAADCVIGDFSTVLFEAKALAKPVFVLEGDYSEYLLQQQKPNIFEVVSPQECRASELLSRAPDVLEQRMFAKGWKENYGRFLKAHGVEVIGV
jgi:hypothetical protein